MPFAAALSVSCRRPPGKRDSSTIGVPSAAWYDPFSDVDDMQFCQQSSMPTVAGSIHSATNQAHRLCAQQIGGWGFMSREGGSRWRRQPTDALYPRSARLVGLPLTVRERSTRASTCRSNTPASISQAKKFQLRQPKMPW